MSIYFKDLEENAAKELVVEGETNKLSDKEDPKFQEVDLSEPLEEDHLQSPLVVVFPPDNLMDQEGAACAMPSSDIKTLQEDEDGDDMQWKIINNALQGYLSSDDECEITEAFSVLQIEEPPNSGRSGLRDKRDCEHEEAAMGDKWQGGDFCGEDSDSDEEEADHLYKRVPPSGLTTVGPMKNLDVDPRDLIAQIDYGEMEETHEVNVTDGVDICCETRDNALKANLGGGRKKKHGTLTGFARQAFTLPLRQLQDSPRFRLSMKRKKPIFGFFHKKKTPEPYYTCEQASDDPAEAGETFLATTSSDTDINKVGASEKDNGTHVKHHKRVRFSVENLWKNSKRILKSKPSTSGRP